MIEVITIITKTVIFMIEIIITLINIVIVVVRETLLVRHPIPLHLIPLYFPTK